MGTVVVIQEDQSVEILEQVEQSQFEMLVQESAGSVFWHEEEIDWDYGY